MGASTRSRRRAQRSPLLLGLACLLAIPLAGGCERSPEAPTELDELSAYLFRNFETDEEGVLEAGMGNLLEFFADVDLDVAYQDRSFATSPLSEDDIHGIVHADRDPALQEPVAMAIDSEHAPEGHATAIIQPDQTPMEPASPNYYVREYLDPTDPSCFPDRGCAAVDTMNDIKKENLVMHAQYFMHKDFRWVEMREAGSGEWALIGRAWCEEPTVGDAGAITIHQSYSLDAFVREDDGTVIRYMSLWTETEIDGVDDSVIEATTRMGMNDMFEATEDWVAEND